MKENKIYQPEQITVKRSQIRFAEYNPRMITEEARKKLKKNMQKIGLLGGVVWNRATGNLISGHQRVAIMDNVNRYDPFDPEQKNDYEFRVEVVDVDLKTEKEQNLFMNNKNVQGTYDDAMLRELLADIDYEEAGFGEFDMEILGLTNLDDYAADTYTDDTPQPEPGEEVAVNGHGAWTKEQAMGDSQELADHDSLTKDMEENRKLDRSTDFYNDTEANQIARHNEVQKIKDRIASQNGMNKDGGLLSYVTLSFQNPTAKGNFLESYGYDPYAKFITGEEFAQRLEFGWDDEEEEEETEE